jgi:hypothetical protein
VSAQHATAECHATGQEKDRKINRLGPLIQTLAAFI